MKWDIFSIFWNTVRKQGYKIGKEGTEKLQMTKNNKNWNDFMIYEGIGWPIIFQNWEDINDLPFNKETKIAGTVQPLIHPAPS